MKLEKWIDSILNRNPGLNPAYAGNYKKDIIFNTIQIYGIFPVDYNFQQNYIEVLLSADYVNGDFNLFKLKSVRKEKLLKIAQKWLKN